MQDQFDALLYLGPPEGITFAQLPPALCTDKSYMDKRRSRMAIAALPTQIERLKRHAPAPNESSGLDAEIDGPASTARGNPPLRYAFRT